jgi:hypothetical protein
LVTDYSVRFSCRAALVVRALEQYFIVRESDVVEAMTINNTGNADIESLLSRQHW